MIDILFLSWNRLEFTRQSLAALRANTDWSLVSRMVIYDDGSMDGTMELLIDWAEQPLPCPVEIRKAGPFRSPVAVMGHYLHRNPADIFAKIDSDCVVCPGWLNACIRVMMENPALDLLGIEPPLSRTRPPGVTGARLVDPEETRPGPVRYVPARAIGGVGLMLLACFERLGAPKPDGTYGGFTGWQQRHTQEQLRRGWIAPPLDVFLLDRMILEPWVSLSREYIARGWQRSWTPYSPEDSALWDWWEPVGEECAMAAPRT